MSFDFCVELLERGEAAVTAPAPHGAVRREAANASFHISVRVQYRNTLLPLAARSRNTKVLSNLEH